MLALVDSVEAGDLRSLLAAGDRRTTGRADEVAEAIVGQPHLFAGTVALMLDGDAGVRMRAADALEKASRKAPALLNAHRPALLGPIARIDQQEVRWHLLQILPRLDLSSRDRRTAFAIAVASLAHASRIVVTEALTALFRLSENDAALRSEALLHAAAQSRSPYPSVRSRLKRLLASAGIRAESSPD